MLVVPAHGQSPSDELVLLLEAMHSFQARYEQLGQDEAQSGELWLQRPNRFRITVNPPLSQTIVSDGQSMWIHDLDLEQVIISNLEDVDENIPLLLFAGDPGQFKDSYEVEKFATGTQVWFVLKAVEDNPAIVGVTIAFEEELPTRLTFQTAMKQTTVINFFETSDDETDVALYQYAVPDGIDIIDDR